jgi:hypothetical protein
VGLFDKLFGPKPAPVVSDLRDTLFGDLPMGESGVRTLVPMGPE